IESTELPTPFLDVLARLEQLSIIPSESEWQFFRNLRNNLAHDYPESVEQTTEALNVLFSEWRRLAQIYTQAREHYQAHRAGA
ncbi:MAG TPA: hypothetical protein VMW87_11500, partial [Spirochaetia bacterium]|nr:hypothetical protein [Spirochaetia bacterium]